MVGMMRWFMEPEKKALMDFMSLLYDKLDDEQRKDVAAYCQEVIDDGKIGLTEWSKFGKKVGAFRLGK
jgi:hypothetical protein